jgi:hypothetical protein
LNPCKMSGFTLEPRRLVLAEYASDLGRTRNLHLKNTKNLKALYSFITRNIFELSSLLTLIKYRPDSRPERLSSREFDEV